MNLNIVHHGRDLLDLSVCGGVDFTLDEIKAVPTPTPDPDRIVEMEDGSQKVIRARWCPVPHWVLVKEFFDRIAETPYEIVQSRYTLAREGQRFFALFEVRGIDSPNTDKIGTVFGLRNSHDQSFRAGICAGIAPFVCTNLAFSNEIVLGRRHTINIMNDLPQVISKAIGRLTTKWGAIDNRIEKYRQYALDDVEAHHLAIEAYRAGAINKTHIADVVKQWHNPDHDDFAERNGWSFYNGVTNVLRGNLALLNPRSEALHGLLDPRFGAIDPDFVEAIDTEEVAV